MESNQAEIQQLRSRLDELVHKQNKLHLNVAELRGEIEELQIRIEKLAIQDPSTTQEAKVEKVTENVVAEKIPEAIKEVVSPIVKPSVQPVAPKQTIVPAPAPVAQKPKEKSSIESFLGENLANKIGIAIILIGVGVGVKYAIDKNILGPAMRIALGFLAGSILISFSIYLMKKYENLSAVLFAGGMAVAYFVTFIAYDFYELFPKMVAFGSMLVLTVITSLAAVRYDKQVIAIIGLVGAYAVPFMLSDGSGTTFSLFVYMSIINCGILYLAFRKAWLPVFSVAFGCTWFIFFILSVRAAFSHEQDYETLLLFGSIFYVLFYAVLIAGKMKHQEQLGAGGTWIVILNSIFGYTFGIIFAQAVYDSSLVNGAFTLLFAASQGAVTFITMKQKEADHRLYYLSFGFALIYATISIPLMVNGNWITLLWTLQAALFFWIGRKQKDAFFEKIAFMPLILAIISLIYSWFEMSWSIYPSAIPNHISPIFNEYFLSGAILSGALFFMAFIKLRTDETSKVMADNGFFAFMANSIVYLGLIIFYFVILQETEVFWEQRNYASLGFTGYTGEFYSGADQLKTIWIIIFTLVYCGVMQLGNRFLLKDKTLSISIGTASLVAVFAFLVIGLFDMSMIRDRALSGLYGVDEAEGGLHFSIRYIGFAALAFVLFANWTSLRHFMKQRKVRQGVEIFLHICLVWIVCSELINLKKMNGGGDLYRAGLTIFGGIYSFALIAFGIWKKKPHLRLLALVLFGITLLKLFIYDISKVDSGGKTVAFISLGVLLLVISFLYTKYKHLILPSEDEIEDSE